MRKSIRLLLSILPYVTMLLCAWLPANLRAQTAPTSSDPAERIDLR